MGHCLVIGGALPHNGWVIALEQLGFGLGIGGTLSCIGWDIVFSVLGDLGVLDALGALGVVAALGARVVLVFLALLLLLVHLDDGACSWGWGIACEHGHCLVLGGTLSCNGWDIAL